MSDSDAQINNAAPTGLSDNAPPPANEPRARAAGAQRKMPRFLIGMQGTTRMDTPFGKGAPGSVKAPISAKIKSQPGILKAAMHVIMAGRQDVSHVNPAEFGVEVPAEDPVESLWDEDQTPGGHIRDDNFTFVTETGFRRPPRGEKWENDEMKGVMKSMRENFNKLIEAGNTLPSTMLYDDIRSFKLAGGKAGYQIYRLPTAHLLMETSQLLQEHMYEMTVGKCTFRIVDVDTKTDLAATMIRERVVSVLQQNGYPQASYVAGEGKVKVIMPWGEFYVYDRQWCKLVQASCAQDVGTGEHEFINASDPDEYVQMQNVKMQQRGWLRIEARFVLRKFSSDTNDYEINAVASEFEELDARRAFVGSILPLLKNPHYQVRPRTFMHSSLRSERVVNDPGSALQHALNYTSIERHKAAMDMMLQRAGDDAAAVYVVFDPSVQETRVDRVDAYLKGQKAPCHRSAVPSILAPYDGAKKTRDFDAEPSALVVWSQTSAANYGQGKFQGFFIGAYQNVNTNRNAAFEALLQGLSGYIPVGLPVILATITNGFRARFGTKLDEPGHLPIRATLNMMVQEYSVDQHPRNSEPGQLMTWFPGGRNDPCVAPRDRARRGQDETDEKKKKPEQPRWGWAQVGVGAPSDEDAPARKHFLPVDWPAQPGHGRKRLPPSLQHLGTLRYVRNKGMLRRHFGPIKIFACKTAERKLGDNRKRERQEDFPVPQPLKKQRDEACHPTGKPRKFRLKKDGDDGNQDASFVPLGRAYTVQSVACYNHGFVVRLVGLAGQRWSQLHPQNIRAIATLLGVDATETDKKILADAITAALGGALISVESKIAKNDYHLRPDMTKGKTIPYVEMGMAD